MNEDDRKQKDFINNRYGLGDLDHDTALDKGHIYDLMKAYAKHQNQNQQLIEALESCKVFIGSAPMTEEGRNLYIKLTKIKALQTIKQK